MATRFLVRGAAALLAVAALAALVVACGDDDGEVRPIPVNEGGSPSGTGSASGSGTHTHTGSASGSATGISTEGLETTTSNDLIQSAVDGYRGYLMAQVDQMISDTDVFTDAIRAGDLEAAKAAYAVSRLAWERIEPIAGLVEEIDGAVDARVDDFENEDDPEFTGWHRLEYILFSLNTTDGAAQFADKLDADLRILRDSIPDLELPPAVLAIGAAELIEEVSQGKITGEEDRYSKTDLWDFYANLEGSKALIRLLTPALEEADPDLLASINAGFDELDETLAPLRHGNGWVPYCQENDEYHSDEYCPNGATVSQATVDQLKAQLASLSENISQTAGALSLQ